MRRLILIFTIILTLSLSGLKAQQQVLFTQYMFNMLPLNPAYAGIHDGISMSFLLREQWVGLEGAPQTQTFSIHSPINFRPIAIGATVIHDKIGFTTQTGLQFNYAYRIKIGKKSKFSMGLQGTIHNYQSNDASSASVNITDPSLANLSEFNPNVGAGVMFYNDRFYAGLSLPQMLNYTVGNELGTTDADSKIVRHYFFTTGYVFNIGEGVKLKPNIMFKAVQGAPMQLDLNANVLLRELLWVGLSYRSLDSFDALVQFQVSPRFQIGYAYDFATTTDLRRVNSGSHEILINYVIYLRPQKIKSPRYF
jgi:type IX secretion system PorP/SprF family membrane protein